MSELLDPPGGEVEAIAACVQPPAFNVVDSRDLDHYRAQPGNWNMQVNKLGKGDFHSHIRSIRLPGMTFYDNRWGAACLLQGQSPAGYVMLGGVVTPQRGTLHWCGMRADRQRFACTSEDAAIEFSVESQAHDVVILIEPDLLQSALGPDALELIGQGKHLDMACQAGGQLIDLCLRLIERCESGSLPLDQPTIAADMQSAVFYALEQCFAGLYAKEAGGSPGLREEALHKAIMHVSEHPRSSSVLEMARAAGVCQKTLEVVFRQVLGITPGKYLVLSRLNAAHHQLANSHHGEQTVTRVASEWGFSHPGRFSGAYRQLFGELPSQTLRGQARS
jgi:AraC-like DNA-binding protein